jgi:enoyl-CoA hydratase
MSDILAEVRGSLGHIRLNRPRAINALTLEMVQGIAAALDAFADDQSVGRVLISGAGERGLCAGGDIRALYDHGRDGSGFGQKFFRDEYRMNAQIAEYKKPYIAFMDGITMGGGVGVSAHGAVRIVTERTRLAMPETGIGFFPDVGGTWLLGRSPGELGTFIGLTGDGIGGADAILAGFADYFVDSDKLPAIVEGFSGLPVTASLAEVRALVQRFAENTTPSLAAHLAEIDACFAFDSVEEIFSALEAGDSEFGRKIIGVLKQKSPTSMKVTLKMLRDARHSVSLRECLEREFVAAHAVLASDEFYEGVRAAVVDKDRNPQWRPAALAEVTPELLAPYFAPGSARIF